MGARPNGLARFRLAVGFLAFALPLRTFRVVVAKAVVSSGDGFGALPVTGPRSDCNPLSSRFGKHASSFVARLRAVALGPARCSGKGADFQPAAAWRFGNGPHHLVLETQASFSCLAFLGWQLTLAEFGWCTDHMVGACLSILFRLVSWGSVSSCRTGPWCRADERVKGRMEGHPAGDGTCPLPKAVFFGQRN